MGVVLFPSLPFMGVVLFPSSVLGNASGEGNAFLASPSPFFVLLSLPSPFFLLLIFHLFFHISFSLFLFLLHKLLPSLFFFSSFPPVPFLSPSSLPPSSALSFSFSSFFSFSLSPLPFFFFGGTICTDCNL